VDVRGSARTAVIGLLLVATAAAAAWEARHAILSGAGALVVSEDPLGPAELMVVSNASARGDALEAARLYGAGISSRVVVLTWRAEPIDDEMRRLGVPYLPATELVHAILVHSGVPAGAIAVLPGPVDGLNSEIAVLATFAREHRPESLLFVTARTHTARARWLLRRTLPAGMRVAVRSPPSDRFSPRSWWESRDQSRELGEEYLRWLNTLILRDSWRRESSPTAAPE
jgi:uncharacterized SAM-binding protein YcdF (DUF218 family)